MKHAKFSPQMTAIAAIVLSALLVWLPPQAAVALTVEAPLPDAGQEAQAQALFHEIRCVVCQSEAIADSPAEVARDLRREIRTQLAEGHPPEAIKTALAAQYGDGILMNPPLKEGTWLLWFGPWLVLAVGGIACVFFFRQSARKPS